MKKLYFTFIVILQCNFVFCQDFTFEWAKAFDGGDACVVNEVICNSANEYFVIGAFVGVADFDLGPGTNTATSTGQQSVFIAKYNSNMELSWVKTLNGTNAAILSKIKLGPDGSIYILGNLTGTVDFDPGSSVYNLSTSGPNDYDIFLLKLNPSGNFTWVKKLGSVGMEYSNVMEIDASGEIIIAGVFNGIFDPEPSGNNMLTAVGTQDIFIEKFNSSGNMVWVKQISGPSGGNVQSIYSDSGGSLYLGGSFQGTVDFDPGPLNFPMTASGQNDVFFIKMSSAGNLSWAKQLSSSNWANIQRIRKFSDGNLFIGCSYVGTIDTDFGSGTNYLSSTMGASVMIKVTPSGNLIWSKQILSDDGIFLSNAEIDASDKIYLAGGFSGTADLDPSSTNFPLITNAFQDAFVAKYTNVGDLIWAYQTGGPSTDYAATILLDQQNNILVTGIARLEVDFDPTPAEYLLTMGGYSNSYFQKLSQNPLGIVENDLSFEIYPNPCQSEVYLKFENSGSRTIEIHDLNGKLIQTIQAENEHEMINISELNSGIYFITSNEENQLPIRKTIIKN